MGYVQGEKATSEIRSAVTLEGGSDVSGQVGKKRCRKNTIADRLGDGFSHHRRRTRYLQRMVDGVVNGGNPKGAR